MTSADTTTANPLSDYMPDDEMAKLRRVTQRTLRAERQRGDGPPYVKDGWRIYYNVNGFREWLRSRERQPVRAGA
jgi:hypothetical protein